MWISRQNLFADLTPQDLERVDPLAMGPHGRIERIVSWGHVSPPGFWYDQAEAEWVAVLSGRARLTLCDPDETIDMGPGDWIWIGAHRKHRVDWTLPGAPTVWLAVFIHSKEGGG